MVMTPVVVQRAGILWHDPAATYTPRRTPMAYLDWASTLALRAAASALEGLDFVPDELGCVLGTQWGNGQTLHRLASSIRQGSQRVSPLEFAHAGANVPTSLVVYEWQARGANVTHTSGPESGRHAGAFGLSLIRAGAARHLLILELYSPSATQASADAFAAWAVLAAASGQPPDRIALSRSSHLHRYLVDGGLLEGWTDTP